MQATACLGISSDWLLTAMVWGKPTVVLGDYGIRTEFNGPLFFGSGADAPAGRLPAPGATAQLPTCQCRLAGGPGLGRSPMDRSGCSGAAGAGPMSLRLLLVADSDSQLLACQALARCADEQGAGHRERHAPGGHSRGRAGSPATRSARCGAQSLSSCCRPRLDHFDAIGVYLTGSKLAEFRSVYLTSQPPARPAPVAPCSAASTAWCWSGLRRRSPGGWATT
jgi:hypothetical protein